MTQITGTLQNATSQVKSGSKGEWTKYTITMDGKDYQCHQDVFNMASPKIGQTIHAEVISKTNGDFTNWYCNAIFDENERGPSNAQERNPDNPAARAMTAQAVSQGLVTELMKHEGISRMAAVKHLIEGNFPGVGSAAFLSAAKTLSDFYLTGRLSNEEKPSEEPQFITEAVVAKAESFHNPAYDESEDLPF